ncbi:RNA 2'-phosphotransferase [Acanthopleuribacter pedis]|uniref:Probable RNA 2'-phosphotransferase n=1 Tax=Acanthopleuribacter pedis TaxID=442870 RepID=A0A8J7U5C3_9BACT|nr:RNA 2'-phosphotransferase [Acanthopleuribacter pedis]MBO1320293.1 RNA 2'-phosphotransferase [Acanthopleuribacter pedis]
MSFNAKRTSKFLSLVLRHQPQTLNLTLDDNGWVAVDTLLEHWARYGRQAPTLDQLHRVVADNDKQRFAFSEDGTRIRANQGHSVKVDLKLEPQQPPARLFHGTATRNVAGILRDGIQRAKRHHVHLSPDRRTADAVGRRHGKLAMLVVDSAAMAADGYTFFCSANGVWLTDEVPSRYLQREDETP